MPKDYVSAFLGVAHGCLAQTAHKELLELLPAAGSVQSPDHCLGRSPANLMERLSDLQQSIFSLPSESHDKLLSGNCLTVQRLGVASQQEEESGLMVTPSALARNDSMIPRSRSTLNLVDSSPAVQLGPQSAELRHPGATQMGSAAESCVTW